MQLDEITRGELEDLLDDPDEVVHLWLHPEPLAFCGHSEDTHPECNKPPDGYPTISKTDSFCPGCGRPICADCKMHADLRNIWERTT